MNFFLLRYPGGKLKAVTLSYDDGCRADLHTAEILDRYGMRGTFNINSSFMESDRPGSLRAAELKQALLDKGHEIAIHGARHLAPGIVYPTTGIADVLNCRAALEATFGTIIRGMAYPNTGITRLYNGNDADNIKGYLKNLGIAYARSLGSDNNSYALPTDWLSWMPTAKHTNPKLFDWAEEFVSISEEKARWVGDKHPRLFYLWGHSYEFDNDNNWDVLERFCETVGGKDDTWYATNIEIHDYVRAYESLIMSTDGNRIYNPSARTVWFFADGQTYSVAAGETLSL